MIFISYPLLEQINRLGEAAYPAECCGLLTGIAGADGAVRITRVVESANVAKGGGFDRFEVDPKVRFDLMRELDGGDEAIVGHFHSHPDNPAKPSETDLSMAFEPELVWLITAVISGQAGKTRAWRLNRETGSRDALELEVD